MFLCLLVVSLMLPVRTPARGLAPVQQQAQPQLAQPQLPRPAQPDGQEQIPDIETRTKVEKEMAKKANQQRQAQIKHDTDQLLELATQLKTYVDKTNENVLSLDVIKKADQIEKLAHNVKEKMRSEQ